MYGSCVILSVFYFTTVQGILWPQGVVHFSINQKDYDAHSQDVIMSTLDKIERDICVKFFSSPLNYSLLESDNKILYISNNDKQKDCPANGYDFAGNVVHMTIGYKCLDEISIARMIVDMLRSTIQNTFPKATVPIEVLNVIAGKNLQQNGSLLPLPVRDYINSHYVKECAHLTSPLGLDPIYRRAKDLTTSRIFRDGLTTENLIYYKDKLWPEGIVIYSVDPALETSADLEVLRQAMTTIMLSTCIVFYMADSAKMKTMGRLHFAKDGVDSVHGYKKDKQIINLHEFTHGSPGHVAHTLSNLIQAVGATKTSNRPDRDNYIVINWNNIEKGKEHLFLKAPMESWIRNLPYDFESVSHAPSNYACSGCNLGEQTVTPLHDPLWQRSMTMGHNTELSKGDVLLLKTLYDSQCSKRNRSDSKTA